MINRIVSVLWVVAALAVGAWAVSIALGPMHDALADWIAVLVFTGTAAYFLWRAWREWMGVRPVESGARAAAARDGPRVRLETQIDALKEAGLVLAPGRTIDDLLISFPRAEYESVPYTLLLVMYGSEVEAEPWDRRFCERAFNFDMECLEQAGDYARAFASIARITGQMQLVADLSDDFSVDAQSCTIRYVIGGRQRALTARVDNDWADPQAVTAFARDIETTIADGRHFWAADNGQASVLFFLTDAEAAKLNAVRSDIVTRYVSV